MIKKQLLLLALVGLKTAAVWGSNTTYVCNEFISTGDRFTKPAPIDGYSTSINLNTGTVVFSSGEIASCSNKKADSILKLNENSSQFNMIFEGKDANCNGTLKLSFSTKTRKATLISIDEISVPNPYTGEITDTTSVLVLGTSACNQPKP